MANTQEGLLDWLAKRYVAALETAWGGATLPPGQTTWRKAPVGTENPSQWWQGAYDFGWQVITWMGAASGSFAIPPEIAVRTNAKFAESLGARTLREVAATLTQVSRPMSAAAVFEAACSIEGIPEIVYFAFSQGLIEAMSEDETSPRMQGLTETAGEAIANSRLQLLADVELPISVSFGKAVLPVRDLLKLSPGSVVELDRLTYDCVDIIINNRVIARGEVVVIEGNYGVCIQEILNEAPAGLLGPAPDGRGLPAGTESF